MILRNCRLIPELCEDFEREMADIRIEGTDIAEILPAGGNYLGEEVIDCGEKTVMPGLFDIHAHLWFEDLWRPFQSQTEYNQIIGTVVFMYDYLRYGYTSIRDMGSSGYDITLKIRNDINAGRIVGPDIKAAGMILTPTFKDPQIPCYSHLYGMPIDGPDTVRHAVRKTLRDGADFIKILGTGTNCGDRPILYEDELAEFQKCCQEENAHLVIHSMSEEGNTLAIKYGAYSIEHALEWSQSNMDDLIQQGYKSSIVLNVAQPGFLFYPPEIQKKNMSGVHMLREDKNVLIGFGTDYARDVFLQTPAMEFIGREKLGFSRIEVLKQATINSAKIQGTDNIRGSIKVGKRADLIVVDGKPDEDLAVFGNKPVYVLKDGAVVSKNGYILTNNKKIEAPRAVETTLTE